MVVRHWMNKAHPQIDIVILAAPEGHVEPSTIQKAPAIIQDSSMHPDRVSPQQGEMGIRSDILANRLARDVACSVDISKTAVDETGLRMVREALESGFDRALTKSVVGIEKNDFVAARNS